MIRPNCLKSMFLTALVIAAVSGPAAAQSQNAVPQGVDVLGLKLNMTVADVVAALKTVGKGRITYHFEEPQFVEGKCSVPEDNRFSVRTGSSKSLGIGERDATTGTYLIQPANDAAPKGARCRTFLTDITYLDFTEQDEKRPNAARLLAQPDLDQRLFPDCNSIKGAPSTATPEAVNASGELRYVPTVDALPPQITACEAIRILMSPNPGEERAAVISRVKVYRSSNPSFESIQNGILAKYGATPSSTNGDTDDQFRRLRLRWTFERSGQLVPPQKAASGCVTNLIVPQNEMTPPLTSGIFSNCAVSVNARIISLRENPYLVRSVSVTALDDAVAIRVLGDRKILARKLNDEAARAQAVGASGKAEKF